MLPHRPYDPSLLDAIEKSVVEWSGMVHRQVFEGTDVLRANVRGGRWNPPEVEAVYCSLQSRTAAAEVDHLIGRQPVPIRRPRITHKLSVRLSRVADVRSLAALEACDITPEMLMSEDNSTPQLIGGAVAWLQCAGLLIPSARDAGDNLVVFVNNMAPADVLEPVSQEVYASPGNSGGR